MKRVLSLAVGCLAIVAVATAFDANKDFATYMKQMLPKTAKAFETKNIKFFEGVMTKDYKQTELGRVYNKKQTLKEMQQMFASCKSIKSSLKIVSTSVKGDVGTAITSGRMTAVLLPIKGDSQTHTMVVDMVEKETWVRAGKIWMIKAIVQVKPPKMTMDGKVFDPSKQQM